jgi:hypothetical protein
MTEAKHPGPARDINLADWLDGVGFHPADTELKQRGHEAARLLVALLATHLHELLPAGRDKSLVFTHLEDVLVRSNRALALGGGPRTGVALEVLQETIANAKGLLSDFGSVVPYDPRISEYEATQRGEPDPAAPLLPFEYTRDDAGTWVQLQIALTALMGSGSPSTPAVRVGVSRGADSDLDTPEDGIAIFIENADALEAAGEYMTTVARQLKALQAR